MGGKHEQYIPHPVEPTASGILGHWIPLVIPPRSHGRCWCIASTPENAARRTCVEQNRIGARGRREEKEVGKREIPLAEGTWKYFSECRKPKHEPAKALFLLLVLKKGRRRPSVWHWRSPSFRSDRLSFCSSPPPTSSNISPLFYCRLLVLARGYLYTYPRARTCELLCFTCVYCITRDMWCSTILFQALRFVCFVCLSIRSKKGILQFRYYHSIAWLC